MSGRTKISGKLRVAPHANPTLPTPRPLLIVSLLVRSKYPDAESTSVVTSISSFLDTSVELTLYKACKVGSVKLLQHIWDSCTPPGNALPISQCVGSLWSLRRFLRTEPHYQQFQFTESLSAAVEQKNIEMVKWLVAHFAGCKVVSDALRGAAEAGELRLLREILDDVSKASTGVVVETGSRSGRTWKRCVVAVGTQTRSGL
ncbi:DNA excision repair protein ERCC-6 [Phytophthora pseudosyringae]|uniref:DNA excision repair protein ERCC-6 n=1 Tax=Phytophthora pseudosyringae TaxID=221518 RepID=A0A8T1VLZ3_9STRA|nr:DNA excision repair protein ERCC-6 [Phytophthora pseudosyringae]